MILCRKMEHEISFYILHCVFFYNLLSKFNDKDSFSNCFPKYRCSTKLCRKKWIRFCILRILRYANSIDDSRVHFPIVFQNIDRNFVNFIIWEKEQYVSNYTFWYFECDLIPPIKLHQYLHSTSKNHECLIESNFARTSNTPIPELFFQTAILCWLRWRFWRDLVVFSHDPTILQLIIL